jgi:electron transfer flavoprotein alpha subunit
MVLVFAEHAKGTFKKAAFEAVTYGRKTADLLGTGCKAVVLGSQVKNPGELGLYGADAVIHVADTALDALDSQVYAHALSQIARQEHARVVVLSHSATGKSVSGRLAVRLDAGLVSGVNGLPALDNNQLVVHKSVFSGKAIGRYAIASPVSILALMGNAIKPEVSGQEAPVSTEQVEVPASRIRVRSVKTQEGVVPLPEAEVVVSGGRGLKEPGNWGIVEDLASALGATTACSRPVADSGWRPHHEHVGQTGIAIRPNLYIAIGISGAIQHLAGVNNSKVIVVINKDPEAPFFKAADFGVQGDLFDVVPKLTQAINRFKEAQQ